MDLDCEAVSPILYNRSEAELVESELNRVFEAALETAKIKEQQLLWTKRLKEGSAFGCTPAEGWGGAKGSGPWAVSVATVQMQPQRCKIVWD